MKNSSIALLFMLAFVLLNGQQLYAQDYNYNLNPTWVFYLEKC